MDILASISQPTGLWQTIIFGIESGVGNYALAIVLVTLMIKVVLLPFDFFNKLITKKNSRKMAKMKPELDKIKQRYVSNSQMANQKTMELYKRENYSVGGTCFGMLIYLVLTMVIFFTLLSGMNSITAYKLKDEFITLQNTYNTTYTTDFITTLNNNKNLTGDNTITKEKILSLSTEENPITEIDYYTLNITAENWALLGITQEDIDNAKENLNTQADELTVKKYKEIKNGFLWITSIWRPDTPSSVTLSYKDFKKDAKLTKSFIAEYNLDADEYNKIMAPIKEEYKNTKNGYLILAVLSGVTTYLSMKISTIISKIKAKRENRIFIEMDGANGGNKAMSLIMPIIMAIFTLLYPSAFGIYIVTGSLFGMITTPLMTMIIDKIDYKKQLKEEEKTVASYSRTKRK